MFKFDSKDRTSGKSHDFEIVLKDGVDGLEGKYEVLMVSVPVSWYNINEWNNTLQLTIGGNNYTITLTPGHYDIDTLMAQLKTALESSGGHGGVMTITLNDITKKLTLECDVAFSLKFGKNSLSDILGFETDVIYTSVANKITSPNITNLMPVDTLTINIGGVVDGVRSSNSQRSTLLVPLQSGVSFGNFNNYQFEKGITIYFANKTRAFQFNVCDARSGKQLDLNGFNWWILLKKC